MEEGLLAQQGHKDRPRSQSADFTGRPRLRHSNRGDMSIETLAFGSQLGPGTTQIVLVGSSGVVVGGV